LYLVEVANSEKLLSKTGIIPLFALHGYERQISSFLLTHTDENWSLCKLDFLSGCPKSKEFIIPKIFRKVERLS
jgi:hypothetical protein